MPQPSMPSAASGMAVAADASGIDPDVFGLGPLLALGDVELDLLSFFQAAVAAAGDRAEVHEHVRAALDCDEAIAFVAVEPLHGALRHLDLVVVHAAPAMAGAALAICFGQPVTESAAAGNRANEVQSGPHHRMPCLGERLPLPSAVDNRASSGQGRSLSGLARKFVGGQAQAVGSLR